MTLTKMIIMIAVIPVSLLIIFLFNRELGAEIGKSLFFVLSFFAVIWSMWLIASGISNILIG